MKKTPIYQTQPSLNPNMGHVTVQGHFEPLGIGRGTDGGNILEN
jgi:hypothetical protein